MQFSNFSCFLSVVFEEMLHLKRIMHSVDTVIPLKWQIIGEIPSDNVRHEQTNDFSSSWQLGHVLSAVIKCAITLVHHWLSPAQTAFIQCSLWHMPLVVGSVVIPLPCQSRDKHLGRVGERRTGERNLYNHTWMGLKWLARRGWWWYHNSEKADREAWPTPCDQHLT